METGRRTWHYFRRLDNHINPPNSEQNAPIAPILEGTTVRFSVNYTTGQFTKKVYSRSIDKDKYNHDEQLTLHLLELAQDLYIHQVDHLDVFGTLKIHSSANDGDDNTQIYRAEPFREGSPWCDWGIFLWSDVLGENRLVLGQMKCFVDLRNIPVPNCRDQSAARDIHTHGNCHSKSLSCRAETLRALLSMAQETQQCTRVCGVTQLAGVGQH